MDWWTVGTGAVLLSAAALAIFVIIRLRDPACAQCHRRDWSKGVPPWRCRRCGASHDPS